MTDWQVGDLALCKAYEGEWVSRIDGSSSAGPRPGQPCTVIDVKPFDGLIGIAFKEFPGTGHFDAREFHRIPPHQADEEDVATVGLFHEAQDNPPARRREPVAASP